MLRSRSKQSGKSLSLFVFSLLYIAVIVGLLRAAICGE